MKNLIVTSCVVALLTAPVFGIGSKRLEGLQKRATTSQKLLAFVVAQGYYAPNCPKCIASVNANNRQINRIAPNKGVIVVKVAPEDLKEGEVPDVVLKAGGSPRVVITDAECTKAIDVVGVDADKKRVKEMEEKIAAALTSAGDEEME